MTQQLSSSVILDSTYRDPIQVLVIQMEVQDIGVSKSHTASKVIKNTEGYHFSFVNDNMKFLQQPLLDF